MDDEFDGEDFDLEIEEVTYAPMAWSWRTFVHNTISAGSAMLRVGAEYMDSVATQVGCSNAKWREGEEKADAADEARRMLSALDEL